MYEDIFNLKLDALANVKIKAINSVEIGVGAPTKFDSGKYGTVTVLFDGGKTATMTGLAVEFSDGSYGYQILFNNQYGYIFSSDMAQWQRVVSTSANEQLGIELQKLIDETIAYNKNILEQNLLCARGLELARDRGVALPIGFRNQLYDLQVRLLARNERLKSSKEVSNIQEGSSPNFSVYNESLVKFMQSPEIGILPIVYVIVIGAIGLIAAGASIAIQVYKANHKEASTDNKFSNGLLANLIKYLPPDVFNQLMSENGANAEKSAEAVKNANDGSLMGTVKTLAVGVVAFWAIDKFLLSRKNNAQ